MKIVICDDNMQVCFTLEKMILDYAFMKNYKVQTEVLSSGQQLMEYLNKGEHVDLLYLDIEMPGVNGVEAGRYIRDELGNLLVQIVYISSYREYAMELFAVSPLHFLVKPLEKNMVTFTLDRAFSLLGHGCQIFSYQTGRDMKRIPIQDIFYFKSLGREVELHTERGMEQFYTSLERVYRQLREHRFFYCHQSFLVNYNKINRISSKEIQLINGCRIPVSQGKWPEVKALQLRLAKEDL